MTTLTSRSGAQELTITLEAGARYATVQIEHLDEFNGRDDSVTLGEFLAHDIIAALMPPIPATRHAASTPQNPIRRHWRRK